MEYRLEKGCHSAYAIQFHLVMCVKYRRKVLVGQLESRLKGLVIELAAQFSIQIIEQESDMDHIYILFSAKPSVALSRFINSLKSVTSRHLRKEFPGVMRKNYGKGRFGLPLIFWRQPDK
jgi:REP-associated tyrosine transposase